LGEEGSLVNKRGDGHVSFASHVGCIFSVGFLRVCQDTGFIDLEVFREILANLGFGDITEQDVQTLVEAADADGDGRVSLADFRKMLPSASEAGAVGTTTTGGAGMRKK
jgi:hypothetical protein